MTNWRCATIDATTCDVVDGATGDTRHATCRQNWEIGRLIVEDEQGGKRKAEYGKAQIAGLAQRLTTEYGNGYDERNLRYMRSFYLAFPIWNTLCSELSWSHYRIIMRLADAKAREWYVNECVACGWSVRELDRQVSTQERDDCCSANVPMEMCTVAW